MTPEEDYEEWRKAYNRERNRKWRAAHREQYIAYQAEWRRTHQEYIKAYRIKDKPNTRERSRKACRKKILKQYDNESIS